MEKNLCKKKGGHFLTGFSLKVTLIQLPAGNVGWGCGIRTNFPGKDLRPCPQSLGAGVFP